MKAIGLVIGLVSLAVIAVYLFSFIREFAGTTYPEHLAALQRDPMASYEQPGLELVNRVEEDGRDTWKSFVEARIGQTYDVSASQSAEAAFDRAVNDALEHGWIAEPSLREETALFSKGTMRLTVALFDRYATKQITVSLRGR